MKAIITKQVENAVNMGRDKETTDTMQLVCTHKGELVSPVDVRWYMGRSAAASVVYCSVWVQGKGIYTSGKGTAGGGGYCKRSAAFASALESAGIELYGNAYGRDPKDKRRAYIGGVGMSAVEAAMIAIAKALGYRGKNEGVLNPKTL